MNFIGPVNNSLTTTPSPRYTFMWRGVNDLGSVTKLVDLSGKGNDSVTFGTAGTPAEALAQPACWDTNPGYITMVAKANAIGDFPSYPVAKLNEAWNYLNGDSLLLFIRGQFVLPGVDAPMLGSGVGATRPGFKATIRAAVSGVNPAGRVTVGFYPNVGVNSFINDTKIALASASPTTDVTLAIFVNGQDGTCSVYVNGAPDRIKEVLPKQDYRALRDLVIGGCINYINYDGVASKVSEVQMLTWTNAAPSNPDNLAAMLHAAPFHRLSAVECP